MKNLTGMNVMQVRVFAPGIIPYRLIITPFGTSHLKQVFGFSSASWNQESWDYGFQDGTLERSKGEVIPVTWVGFNDRRIVVQVLGDSDAAHSVYSVLSEGLSELAPSFRGAAPLLFDEETSCAAQLDFEWTALLNPALVDRVSKKVKELSTESVRRFVKGVNLRFTVGATAADERLSEHGIPILDQTIIVEPRVEVPLSERTYFTTSPFDSDTHLQLVSELEASLLNAKQEARSERGDKGKRSRQEG